MCKPPSSYSRPWKNSFGFAKVNWLYFPIQTANQIPKWRGTHTYTNMRDVKTYLLPWAWNPDPLHSVVKREFSSTKDRISFSLDDWVYQVRGTIKSEKNTKTLGPQAVHQTRFSSVQAKQRTDQKDNSWSIKPSKADPRETVNKDIKVVCAPRWTDHRAAQWLNRGPHMSEKRKRNPKGPERGKNRQKRPNLLTILLGSAKFVSLNLLISLPRF